MKQIYVHGLGQTSDSWTKTIDILQTTDYSLCPNLPDLVHSKEVTYDNLYAAFSDYCNQYDEPIDLCGLSLGGVLALNYAIQYPKKVRSLVLIATQYKMPKKLLKFQNLLFRFMPKSMFQQMGFRKADFLLLCETMMELDFNNSLHKISCPYTIVIWRERYCE
jgi:pimeloyl-ACP methyl ester carboxylesterase